MGINRQFLGWGEPCLASVAQYLVEKYSVRGVCDLSEILVVTPGRRASRRLLERLAGENQQTLLTPPKITTPGRLPERLYQPTKQLAGPIQSLLIRAHTICNANKSTIKKVFAHQPDSDDITSWITLARELESIQVAMASENLRLHHAVDRLNESIEYDDETRWQAIAQLQDAYEQALDSLNLADRDLARMHALQAGQCQSSQPIVMIALHDPGQLLRQMLLQAAEHNNQNITVLIHAPQDLEQGFDELGCMVTDYWHEQPLDIPTEMLKIVDRPNDQARQVVRSIQEFQQADPIPADQISVGVGDAKMLPAVERMLDLANVPVRQSVGQRVTQSRPALLLSALSKYLTRTRIDDFAVLLRHPDLEAYLLKYLDNQDASPDINGWLTLLDQYITDHLNGQPTSRWLGDPEHNTYLKQIRDTVHRLWPLDVHEQLPLGTWSKPIAAFLDAVYNHLELYRTNPEDEQLAGALNAIADTLRNQAELDPDAESTPVMTASQAINFTLSQLTTATVPSGANQPAVELLGWLELQLDDAPNLVVTSLNESFIPQSMTADAFLPDTTRRILGLVDNRRRYARDLLMLTAIINSRPNVRLIAGRRTMQNDPLTPSRLLLARPENEIPHLVKLFYAEEGEWQIQTPLLEHGDKNFTTLQPPPPPADPIDQLRVTAFKDYLACPYRFYLKHVLKLKALEDTAVEMDGATFGNIAHESLCRFGRSKLAGSTDPKEIASFLRKRVDELLTLRYGDDLPTAVTIQREQLANRLNLFAQWQATRTADGWIIQSELLEKPLTGKFKVDQKSFTIHGRIDRIDYHPSFGYEILDYKTGKDKPETTHRKGKKGDKQWIDLQLPLYLKLTESLKLPNQLKLGYILICEDPEADILALADWPEPTLQEAFEKAKKVIRNIRNNVFWPPADPPPQWDDYPEICMVQSLDKIDFDEGESQS